MTARLPASARTLLAGAIDYAGLFPPAALTMPDAVAEYDRVRRGPDRWALGRFVVPAARLDEFLAAAREAGLLPAPAGDPVPLAVLATGDLPTGVTIAQRVAREHGGEGLRIDAIETRATAPAEAAAAAALVPPPWEAWVEIPLAGMPGPLIEAVLGGGGLPKIRTGGVEPELFPPPEAVVAFLQEATRRGTPFKATAGLHHPVRGAYPYTYEPGSGQGKMYGYLNLLVATALALEEAPAEEITRALLDEDPEAFAFSDQALTWRGRRVDAARLAAMRSRGVRAFGSCSFEDPMRELEPLLAS